MNKLFLVATACSLSFVTPAMAHEVQTTSTQAAKPMHQMEECQLVKEDKKVDGMMMKNADGKMSCHAMTDMKMDHSKMKGMDHSKMKKAKPVTKYDKPGG